MSKRPIKPAGSSTSRRHVLGLLSGVAVSAIGIPRVHAAGELGEIKKRGLVVATEDDFRPFEFVKDGQPTGFDNDLVAIMKNTAGFPVKQEILPWTGLLAGVTTGKYDCAIPAAIITKERAQSLAFTRPIKDLSGKTCGVQAGSALLARLPELKGLIEKAGGQMGKVVEYTSYPEAYQDLALGRTDYVVNTIINIKALVAEKPNVFELGQAVSGKSLPAWAVRKGNAELLAFLNDFIAKQKADGTFWALQKKYFGEEFRDLPVSWTPEF